MKFDTRNKKPKLWNLLIQGVFVALLLLLAILDGAHRHTLPICALLDLYVLAALIQLLIAFFRQIQYNPYSYNTIYYMGFALFLLAVWIMLLTITARLLSRPVDYGPDEIFHTLLGSAKSYMFFSFPFLLIFSIALCVSNVSLIRHEGRRLVNVLGILLSFLIVGGAVFLFFFDYAVSGSQREILIHELITNLFASVYLYFECMLLGVIAAFYIVSRYEPEPDKDFLIILGCGLRKDGTPSPLLRGRCDRALAFAEKQKAQTGRELIFVTSGGQGPDEPIPESASMKRYLMEQGVPEERIVEEDRSTDTRENMKFSKELILKKVRPGKEAPRGYWPSLDDPEAKIAFATTNYHVFRSGLCARRVKMRAVGMGAKTKWYFWPNAAVREFVGLLTEHRLKQALVFGGMLVFYLSLTLLLYS